MDNVAKKRILILGTAYPYRGGLAAFNECLAHEFQHQGHEVIIFTFKLQYPSFLFPGKSQFADTPPPKGIAIYRIVNSINPFNWISTGIKILKWKPDIVVTKYWLPFMAPCFASILRIVGLRKTIKKISIIDNIIPHEKRIGDTIFNKYFVSTIHQFICMSRNVYNDMHQFVKKTASIHLSYHPIYDNFGALLDKNEARKKLQLSQNDKIVLFFGIIRDYKGLDILLDAIASPALKDLNVKVLVAGEFYNDKPEYEVQIAKNGIQNQVILSDKFIRDDEVNLYFSAADVVVQPYKHATQSGVTQICYHFNKPMIVTNVGGLPEMVEHNAVGFVVEPNAKEISNAIFHFYEQNLEEKFSKNVEEAKKKYSWTNFVANLLKIAEYDHKK